PLVGVRVPVIMAGTTTYVLTIAVPAEILMPLLDQSVGELSWTVEVADRMGRIIARSDHSSEFVGKAVPARALDQLRWNKKLDHITTEKGLVLQVVDRSALAGWIVAGTV